MKFRILMITYNRAEYTALSLARLVETVGDDARITVWDNASNEETKAVLRRFETHPRVDKIIFNKSNDRLWGPTNWFWKTYSDAEYLSKVDDDGLMPDDWTSILAKAHEDIPAAGILGTWRFPEEDYQEELALKKVQTFGPHRIFRNCWVEGSGYLMKRAVIEKIGLLQERESFTTYCTRAAAAGFINGWYFPFLYQEHMDDPRAAHSGMKTEEDFHRLMPLSAGTFSVKNRDDWTKKLQELAHSLQACSYDPSDYIGLKAALKRKFARLLGKPYVPKAR